MDCEICGKYIDTKKGESYLTVVDKEWNEKYFCNKNKCFLEGLFMYD